MQRRDLLRGGSIALALTVAGCTGDTEDVEDNSSGNGNGDAEDTPDGENNESGDGSAEADNESDGLSEGEGNESENASNDSEGLTDDGGDGGANESGNESDDSNESSGDGGNGASGDPSVEIIEQELVSEEGEFSTNVYVDARVENTGDAASGMIELTADWYDGEENFLDNSTAYLQTLPAGEVWNAHVSHLGSSSGDVAAHELNGDFTLEPINFSPDGLELVTDELLDGEDEVLVRGEVENNTGGEAGYIQAVATFYNADGEIITDNVVNVTDVPDGETWSFEVQMLAPNRAGEVDSYEVRIADSAW